VNREVTTLLVEAGRRYGFNPEVEYRVPGGRLDVVWSWEPADLIPGLPGSFPVVGFEVESSWRTRKHLKGDYLNLVDAGVSFGVIVIAGVDPRDESLRRFAQSLVDRPGPKMAVWTVDDVRRLAASEEGAPLVVCPATQASPTGPPTGSRRVLLTKAPHGKYAALTRWLLEADEPEVRASFADIEAVLGFPLPPSCRAYVAHWHGYDGSAVARAIADAGRRTSDVSLGRETLTFVRLPPLTVDES
jgi:hypothetical protein